MIHLAVDQRLFFHLIRETLAATQLNEFIDDALDLLLDPFLGFFVKQAAHIDLLLLVFVVGLHDFCFIGAKNKVGRHLEAVIHLMLEKLLDLEAVIFCPFFP